MGDTFGVVHTWIASLRMHSSIENVSLLCTHKDGFGKYGHML